MKIRDWIISFLALFLVGCQQNTPSSSSPEFSATPSTEQRVFVLGVHPLYNAQKLTEVFTPLIEYLNRQFTNHLFILETSKDYADYNQKLRNEQFDFALPNPYQTLLATRHGYEIIAKMAPDDDFVGIIITAKANTPARIEELKGASISFPAPSAVAATMLPQWYLYEHGLKLHQDYQAEYVGSQESSILSVANGMTQAAATWPPPWRQFQHDHPQLAQKLHVAWRTDSLPNNGFVARQSLPKDVKEKVASLLINLNSHHDGQSVLAQMRTARFDSANQATYAPLTVFIDRFEQHIRLTETP